jgi:putative aldouronate transport system substrate-binding protein
MKQPVRYSIGLIVMIAMLISLFTGCTGNQTTSTTGQSSATTATTTATTTASQSQTSATTQMEEPEPYGKYEPEITINYVRSLDSTVKFTPGDPGRDSLEKNVWAEAYKENLGITLNYLWTPAAEQYEAKWNAAVASGDIPDMGVVSLRTLKMLVEGGLAADMTDIYLPYAADQYLAALESDNGNTVKYNTFNGIVRGLPVTGSQPDDMQLLYVRKDWLDKAGLGAPQTIDDLVNAARAFTENKLGGDGTFGLAACKDIVHGTASLAGFFNGFGAYYNIWLDRGDGKLVYSTIQPEVRSALLKLQEMYAEGLLDKEFAIKEFDKAGESIAAGKVGMTYGMFWAPLFKMNDNIFADETADWQAYPLPSIDGQPAESQAASIPFSYFFIHKDFEYPEAAVKMANLQMKFTFEDNATYATGSDGWEYHKYMAIIGLGKPWANGDNQLKITEAFNANNASLLPIDLESLYEKITAAAKGDRQYFPEWLVFGPQSSFALVNENRFSGKYLLDAYQTLPTDTMNEKSQGLNDKLNEAILKVIMGASIQEFDNAVAEWKAIGGDAITQEANEWYANNR